jgi:hypothetical protein
LRPVLTLHIDLRAVAACAMLLPLAVYADAIPDTYGALTSFSNGTVADATQVNGNFNVVRDAINGLEDRVDAVEGTSGGVLQLQTTELAGTSGTLPDRFNWSSTGNTVTITPNAAGNTLKLDWTHTAAATPGSSHTCIDIRLRRTSPSSAVISDRRYVGADGRANSLLQIDASGHAIDTAVDTSPHTYVLEVRSAIASSSETSSVFPNWYISTIHNMTAIEYGF